MTLEEVLASEEIELVVNLTAPFAHYDVIKQALNASKHVFTEKMLCRIWNREGTRRSGGGKGAVSGRCT